jgi:DNA-binding transcriptional MerR regulator
MTAGNWRIDDLAQLSGVPVDTIRFYQREGLVPAGERKGRSMAYGTRHLERLERIRALQGRRFSLAAIQAILEHDRPSLETLLAGREGAAYEHDELLAAASVGGDLARGLEKTGLLTDPDAFGLVSYDADDLDVLRAFAELRDIGVPDNVLVELARVLTDGIESVTRESAALFHAENGPRWDPDVRARFEARVSDDAPHIARAVREITDYLLHRSLQRLVIRKLEAQHGAPNQDPSSP